MNFTMNYTMNYELYYELYYELHYELYYIIVYELYISFKSIVIFDYILKVWLCLLSNDET